MKTKQYLLTAEERRRIIERLVDEVSRRNEVVFANLYGSFVEGPELPVHDIDVGVYVVGIGRQAATPYSLELSQALSKQAGLPVDVMVLNFSPVSFLYHVIRGSLLFVRDEDVRSQVVEHAIRRYLDLKPLLRRSIQEAFAA